MNDEVIISKSKEYDGFTISVHPPKDVMKPQLPFLQPGNFYQDFQGARYRIISSMMDEYEEGDGGYYVWKYEAERV